MSGGSTSGTPTTADLGNGIVLTAPTSSSSTASPYGITNGWGTTKIDLTGFPLAVMQALSKAGLDTSQPQPGDAIAAALAKIPDRAVVNQLQQMLFYGGFYASSVTNLTKLQLGKFGPEDVSALKNLVQTGGQTGQPLGSYLVGAANYGQAQGTINKVAGVGVTPIPIPADASIDAALKASAANLIGHDPSTEQLSEFRGIYDKLVVSASKQAAALQAKATAQTTALSQDPEAVGAAAGRLGLPGYFGDSTEQPPTPGNGAMQSPWQTLISGQRGVMGPSANGYQVPGTQADAQESGQEQAASAYAQQQSADQNTVTQFTNAAGSALANSQPTVVSAPSLGDAADQFLAQQDAPDVAAQKNTEVTKSLLSILAGKGY